MAIYKYTLQKYLKSKSTWIIALISGLLIGFIVGGILPFTLVNPDKANASTTYTTTVVAAVAGVTSFLSIFASVFAGFKAASMYKDEVEDGTFLVMLSKPMKRSTIIFSKWFALQTVILGYTIFTVLCFALGIMAFDKGDKIAGLSLLGVKTATSQIWLIAGFIAVILFITGTIFSSIGILLSTKLSVGSTIGISIALGIIIPITSLIGAFTKTDEFKTFSNSSLVNEEMKLRRAGSMPIIGSGAVKLADELSSFEKSQEVKDIYTMGIATGDKSAYNFLWFLDLNYQVSQMSSLAYNEAIPDSAKQLAINARASSASSTRAPGLSSQKFIQEDKVALGLAYDKIATVLDSFYKIAPEAASYSTELLQAALMSNISNLNKEVQLVPLIATTLSDAITGLGDSSLTPSVVSGNKIKISDLIKVFEKAYKNSKSQAGLYPKINDRSVYGHAVTTDKETWYAYQINQIKEDLLASLSDVPDLGSFNRINIKDSIIEFSKLLVKLDSPLTSFLLNGELLASAASSELSDANKAKAMQAFGQLTSATSPKININAISRADRDAIINIMAANEANKLVHIKSADYVDAKWLLIGYLAVALLLVPLAYSVVRKQDFR